MRVDVEYPKTDVDDLEELVQERVHHSKRIKAKQDRHERVVRLPTAPVGLFVIGDPHVDNDGCDWDALYNHVKLIQATPGILSACVGDMQDNWVGRLAKLYAKSSVTAEDGWRLSEWLLKSLDWIGIVGGNHDCHDDQTEVLTRRGWLKFSDVCDEDQVLGLTQTGEARWQNIDRRVEYDFNGELYRIENSSISAAITQNHRVLHKKRTRAGGTRWSELTYATPPELKGRIAIPVAGSSTGSGTKHTDAELRMAAWILTDGCISYYKEQPSRIDIYQRESNASMVRVDLIELGVSFTERKRDRNIEEICGRKLVNVPEAEVCFRIAADDARHLLARLNMTQKVTLPNWIWDLSEKQFTVFLSGMMEGDGTWAKSGNAGAFYGRQKFVEELQAACVANGYSASLYRYRDDQYRLNICHRKDVQFDWEAKQEHYEGKIYCLTVPLSNFAVRRNGKVHYSGNSWAHGAGIDPMQWLTEKCGVQCYAPDELRITINWQDTSLEPLNWLMRHDFSGRSWFHPTHGPHKEAMLDGKAHILTAGHLHQWGHLAAEQRHGRVTHAIRVRGYKRKDDYAKTHGFHEQLYGESVLIVVDPRNKGPGRISLHWDIAQGCDYLTWLRASM